MSAAGTRTMGPSCCCCNDIFAVDGPGRLEVDGSGNGTYTETALLTLSNHVYFDYVNKELYCLKISGADAVVKLNHHDLDTTTTVITVDPRVLSAVAVHPQNGHVFYAGRQAVPNAHLGFIRRCDMSGGNDTEIFAFDNSPNSANVLEMTVTKDEEYLFFHRNETAGLARIDADGSNFTEIIDPPVNDAARNPCVDNVNKVLFYVYSPSGVGLTQIYRSAFDGSSNTKIFDKADGLLTLPGSWGVGLGNWSHKHQRLYFFAGSSTGNFDGHGIYSMNSSGSDIREECVKPNVTPSSAWVGEIQRFKLGCGFEVTGSGTMAS